MGKNIKGQCTFAINQCFAERTNKYSFKSENGRGMSEKIFSFSEKYRLKDISNQLQNYIREHDPSVKQVKDITPGHIQGFLNSKIDRCTQNTINTHAESLYKLQNTIEKTYSVKLNWREEIAIPAANKERACDRGVESVISREDYNKIIEYSKNHYSQSGACIILQNELGIRVEELARIKLENIDLKNGRILIEGKGGREITRDLSSEMRDFVKEIKEKEHDPERLFSINGASINKQLGRIQEALGLEKHSNHDIRRLIAQEKYDGLRAEGKTIKEATNETSNWLSHGDNREDMLERSYVVIR
jgi:integrase